MAEDTTCNPINNILILNPSGTDGCVPDKGAEGQPGWDPCKNTLFAIYNQSGAEQTLTEITAKIIRQADPKFPLNNDNSTSPASKTLTIVTGGVWIGKVGNAGQGGDPANGTFKYNDGKGGAGMRTGTINPG